MYAVGVDLSGPAGTRNTGVAVFQRKDAKLHFLAGTCDGSDAALLEILGSLSDRGPVVVGFDAPLSYQPGGGDRARDKQLRRDIVSRGMHPGSVMAPTAPRMVYLTLRGIALSQVVCGLTPKHPISTVEIHPGAAMCFRDAPLAAVRTFSGDESARQTLLSWLRTQSLEDLISETTCTSHFVAACAAALAASDWAQRRHRWLYAADKPWHPYDFAC